MKEGFRKLPCWLKKKKDLSKNREIKKILRQLKLNTVCEEAKCPNITECFSNKTATFMILGKSCTRKCRFCAVSHGDLSPVSKNEPEMVLNMVNKLGLNYVVITSVTRDDLFDGGSGQFCRVIGLLKENNPHVKVEVLVPDFKGSISSVVNILEKKPHVFNHNLETISSLYKDIRPQADYDRSLKILRTAREQSKKTLIKTGIMIGFGESIEELTGLFHDIKDFVDILTIGQYLAPSKAHIQEKKFYSIEEYDMIKHIAQSSGISQVIAGPFVRSSYEAQSAFLRGRQD